jgi:hypothetical protein
VFPVVCVVQYLTAFVATLLEMPQAGSGPMNRRSDLSLAKAFGTSNAELKLIHQMSA